MQNIQNGFGAVVTATSTAGFTEFKERGTNRYASTVSVKNKGDKIVRLLINTTTNISDLAQQFALGSAIPLDAGDTYEFLPADAATGLAIEM